MFETTNQMKSYWNKGLWFMMLPYSQHKLSKMWTPWGVSQNYRRETSHGHPRKAGKWNPRGRFIAVYALNRYWPMWDAGFFYDGPCFKIYLALTCIIPSFICFYDDPCIIPSFSHQAFLSSEIDRFRDIFDFPCLAAPSYKKKAPNPAHPTTGFRPSSAIRDSGAPTTASVMRPYRLK